MTGVAAQRAGRVTWRATGARGDDLAEVQAGASAFASSGGLVLDLGGAMRRLLPDGGRCVVPSGVVVVDAHVRGAVTFDGAHDALLCTRRLT